MKMIVNIFILNKTSNINRYFQGQLCRHGVDISLIHQTLDKKLLRVNRIPYF